MWPAVWPVRAGSTSCRWVAAGRGTHPGTTWVGSSDDGHRELRSKLAPLFASADVDVARHVVDDLSNPWGHVIIDESTQLAFARATGALRSEVVAVLTGVEMSVVVEALRQIGAELMNLEEVNHG